MAARAEAVGEADEVERVLQLFSASYPVTDEMPVQEPSAESVRIFRVTPAVISVLDYSKGFGHTDLVSC